MQRAVVINPQKNSANVDRQVWLAERVFLIVAILITSIGFFVWGRSAAAQYTEIPIVQTAVGIAAAIASAFVTDFAFRSFLEEVVFQGLAWFHPNVVGRERNQAFFRILAVSRWALLVLVVGALFLADWYSVQAIRDPFASAAKQTETTDLTAASTALAGSLKATTAPMAEQISALKKDIAAAERRTESTNTSLAALVAQGNGWAAREMEKKKERATRSARKQLAALQGSYTEALSRQSATIATTSEQITTRNAEIEEQNRQKRYTLSGMYFMFGAGSKALTVVLRIFLVISFLSKTPTLDVNGDGVVDGRDVTDSARGSFR